MTTVFDVCSDARRIAYGSMSEQINLAGANVIAGATTIPMQLDVTGITPGSIISSGLNVWYVKSVNGQNSSVSVIPGYDNAPQEAVTQGDVIRIKPRVTDFYLFSLFNDEMRKLSSTTSGLYKIGAWTANVEPSYQTYEIPLAAIGMVNLLRVRYRLPGTPDVWTALNPSYYNWQATPTGNRVQLLIDIPSGTEIEFTYKSPFTQATSLTDDVVADCGLSDSMTDIPALGMVITLLRTTDSRRNQIATQGDPRRADEVGPATNLSSAAAFERDYKARVQDEYARLIQRYPIFMGV
jgi:hypothetical protein